MRKVARSIDKNYLPKFRQYLIEDGWTIHERPEPGQALKAWKMTIRGDKRKWCIINHSPNLDAPDLVIPSFSTPMTEDFFKRFGL